MQIMIKPNKTQILITTVIVLVIAGLVGGSAYLYQTNRKPQPTESVSQLKTERDNAVKAMVLHDNVNRQQTDALNTQVQNLTIEKAGLCTQIKSVRLVNASCNQ